MAINLHLLRLFTAVVDHDGVVAASRVLRISQPAVSRAVRELEHQLGLVLFDRSGRRAQLTATGAEVYKHARSVFAAEHAVEDVIAGIKGLTQGTLRIAASTTIATYVLPRVIAAFTRAYPAIELQLSSVHTRVIVDLVRSYGVDVALAEAPVDAPDILEEPWQKDPMVIVAGGSHRLAGRTEVSPAVLSSELFILREPESGTRVVVLRALKAAGVDVHRTMAVDGTEVIKQLVAEGMGLAVMSRVAVENELQSGKLVAIKVRRLHIERTFNYLSLPRRRPSLAAQEFRRMLDDVKTIRQHTAV